MRVPMPSPTGRNTENLFINAPRIPRAAYDAALNDAAAAELLAFVTGKLTPEDLAEFCKLAGIDPGMSMDDSAPFNGMPQSGGTKYGQDARRYRPAMTSAQESDFARRYPHAARIKIGY